MPQVMDTFQLSIIDDVSMMLSQLIEFDRQLISRTISNRMFQSWPLIGGGWGGGGGRGEGATEGQASVNYLI